MIDQLGSDCLTAAQRTYDPVQLLRRYLFRTRDIGHPVQTRLTDHEGAWILVVYRLILLHLSGAAAGALVDHVGQCSASKLYSSVSSDC